MTKWTGLAVLLAAAALWQGGATDQQLGGTTPVGKVEQVYIEAYPGLFVDRTLASAPSDQPQWVSLSFAPPLNDARRGVIAMLEKGSGVQPGDLVQVRLAGNAAFGAGPEPEYNRVTALVAKRGSQAALSFAHQANQGAHQGAHQGPTKAAEWLSAALALP